MFVGRKIESAARIEDPQNDKEDPENDNDNVPPFTVKAMLHADRILPSTDLT
jgi:hypothetical protein